MEESGTDAKSSVRESSIMLYANPIDEESSSRVDNATSEMKRERRRQGENGKQRTSTGSLMKRRRDGAAVCVCVCMSVR